MRRASFDSQKRFVANASHELRTPLTITQTLLDVARTDPARDAGELVDRLHVINTRAIDLTEALLLLSRAGSVAEVLWLQPLNGLTTAALMSIPLAYMQEAIKGRVGLSTSLFDVTCLAVNRLERRVAILR